MRLNVQFEEQTQSLPVAFLQTNTIIVPAEVYSDDGDGNITISHGDGQGGA